MFYRKRYSFLGVSELDFPEKPHMDAIETFYKENRFRVDFLEKPQMGEGFINGGFFILSPDVLDLIEDDNTVWEREPMEKLAEIGQLTAFRHTGFWQPMDTQRDHRKLEELWASGQAGWKIW